MKPVTVYTTQYCPFCVRAKSLLKNKNVPFEEVDLTNDTDKRQAVAQKTGWMTVPMIYIGEEFIGGADELYALESQGRLDEKLKS